MLLEFKIFPITLSGLPLLLLNVVVVGRVKGLDLRVTVVSQSSIRLVVGPKLQVLLGSLDQAICDVIWMTNNVWHIIWMNVWIPRKVSQHILSSSLDFLVIEVMISWKSTNRLQIVKKIQIPSLNFLFYNKFSKLYMHFYEI